MIKNILKLYLLLRTHGYLSESYSGQSIFDGKEYKSTQTTQEKGTFIVKIQDVLNLGTARPGGTYKANGLRSRLSCTCAFSLPGPRGPVALVSAHSGYMLTIN